MPATTEHEPATLNPATEELLHDTEDRKIKFIRCDRFIEHESARVALETLKRTYEMPATIRTECVALIGDSNSGKSAITAHFQKIIHALPGVQPNATIIGVEAPARCTAPRLEESLATVLGFTFTNTLQPRQVSRLVRDTMRELGTHMLIVQEFQNIKPVIGDERQVVYDTLKSYCNQGIHVVVAGTNNIEALLREDPQIHNRFRPVRLRHFQQDNDYLSFLRTIETFYPLPQRSYLEGPELSARIFARTKGIVGEVVSLCNAAAVHAVENHKAYIDLDSVLHCRDYIPI